MAAASYDLLLKEVMPLCPGAPQPVIVNAIRNAAIEFCEQSLCWQSTTTATVLSSGWPLTVSVPTDTQLSKVLSVVVGGRTISPASIDELDEEIGYTDWRTMESNTPRAFYMPDYSTIQLFPKHTEDVSVTLRIAVSPSLESVGLDEQVYRRHYEGLAAGALARLLAMDGYQWANPNRAASFAAKFEAAKNAARVSSNKSHGRTELRVNFPRA